MSSFETVCLLIYSSIFASISSFEEFLRVQFNNMKIQTFTYTEYIERVKEIVKDDAIILELKVAEEDMGKVIGKQGRIAKAIRNVVKAAAMKENKKVVVDIV